MIEDTILTDTMFWARLASATCASLAASGDVNLRRQWIDNLIPENSKPSNEGLRVEGVAYLMGHKNGRFGDYRFFVSLPWSLVRRRDRQAVIEEIGLDHDQGEIHLVVSVAVEKPHLPSEPTAASRRSPTTAGTKPATSVPHF